MDPAEKYLFDTLGYIVIRNVLSPTEVAAANAAIEEHRAESLSERTRSKALRLDGGSAALKGSGRVDCGDFLMWDGPGGDVFRSMLAHPKLIPYVNELCGKGHRLDHNPLLFTQPPGAEGFYLHGGNIVADGSWNVPVAYEWVRGQMYNSLLAATVQLTDVNPEDGGFVIVPGSHKANFPPPSDLVQCKKYTEGLQAPKTKAGDVVLFCEGTLHGTLPWKGLEERRAAIYRFTMPTRAYARGYFPQWPAEIADKLTEEQRVVLQPPYHGRLDRPALEVSDEGETAIAGAEAKREQEKIDFDKKVFGRAYF